jgi:hypothetical protein
MSIQPTEFVSPSTIVDCWARLVPNSDELVIRYDLLTLNEGQSKSVQTLKRLAMNWGVGFSTESYQSVNGLGRQIQHREFRMKLNVKWVSAVEWRK